MPTRTENKVRRGLDPSNLVNLDVLRTVYRSWSHTPDYRARKASGAPLPDLPFYYEKFFPFHATCTQVVKWAPPDPPSTLRWSGDRWVPSGFYTPGSVVDYHLSQSKFGLISKAKGHQFSAPVFLAEGKKTATMVYQRADNLVQMIRLLRRGKIDQFVEAMHDSVSKPSRRKTAGWKDRFRTEPSVAAANVWLEASYGWVPFLSEVRGAVNTLMDVVDLPVNQIASVRSSNSGTYEFTGSEMVLFAFASGYYRIWAKPVTLSRVSSRSVWRFKPGTGDIPGRFGLLNPLEVAWELVPFSFVADWFLPIGDYLSSLDAPFRFTHVGGTTGTRIEESTRFVLTNFSPANISTVKLNVESHSVRVTRTPITSVPIPRLAELSFGGSMGVARAITSISLLRQQLSRLTR